MDVAAPIEDHAVNDQHLHTPDDLPIGFSMRMDTDNDNTVFPCSDVREKIRKDPDLRDKLNAQRSNAAKHKRVTGPKASDNKPKAKTNGKGAVKDLRDSVADTDPDPDPQGSA